LLSLIFTLSVITGGIVWWPGVSRWKRSLGMKVKSGWRRFNWDLHGALGFWLFFFMLMCGVSGWYLGMPEPLTNLVERMSDLGSSTASVQATSSSSGCLVCTSGAGGTRRGDRG
jgi:uncharacterized iron-regulated membrane protein